MNTREISAITLTLLGLAAVAVVPFWYQKHRLTGNPGVRTIVLTGVAPEGLWTTDEVTGGNYWKGKYKSADIRLQKGETVRLILRSADVTHKFYMPELGIGPIQLIPGHTEEVELKTDKVGIFHYYCTEMCGDCHFHMKGTLTVGSGASVAAEVLCEENHTNPPASMTNILEKGHYLFDNKGCVTCHGVDGVGGVPNFNYAKGTVPALNTLASKMTLESKNEVDAFIKAIDQKEEPSKDKPAPGVSNWLLSFAQYQSVVKTILGGSPPLKADAQGPEPPLFMPAWKEKLDKAQMNSIIAYLLSQQKFEEHKGWGE
jgi:mono/diheme cytochrome c family protein/plastocyanin